MNKTYVDKCMGDDCACHLATKREIKKISGMRIESISLTYEPSIFPGAGGMRMIIPPDPLRGRRVG